MSRVQCTECGIPVVVDPAGLCPEGHFLGKAGHRIDDVIASDTPHPDEPEPWVNPVDVAERAAEPTTPEARIARPPAIAGVDLSESPPAEPGDFLHELQTLEATGTEGGGTPSDVPGDTTLFAVNGNGNGHPNGHGHPTGDSGSGATEGPDAAADEAALEAAVHTMSTNRNGHPSPPPPQPPGAAAATGGPAVPEGDDAAASVDHLDDLDALFTDHGPPASSSTPEVPQATASPPPPPPPLAGGGPSYRSAALADMAALGRDEPHAGAQPEHVQEEPATAEPAIAEPGTSRRRRGAEVRPSRPAGRRKRGEPKQPAAEPTEPATVPAASSSLDMDNFTASGAKVRGLPGVRRSRG